jgi:hypothetical protein
MPIKLKDFLNLVHKRISMMLKLLLLIGAILLFLAEQYQAAAETLLILFVTFLPLILGNRFKVRIPHEFESLAILFICLSLFFGEVLDFYNRYWWWDTMLHTGAGFLLGILGFLLVYVMNENESIQMHLPPGFIALFACMFAISIGVLWEIFEYFMDQTFGMNMQKSGLHDTMLDLIVDTIGAVTISIMGYGYLKTVDRDSFLERWIDRFIAANPHFFGKEIEPDDIDAETKQA